MIADRGSTTLGRSSRDWTWGGELAGALGDLGITVPLAYALAASSGYPAARLFLLWGVVYVATGLYYRLPVSVQPLKAMAVVAIAGNLPPDLVGTAAVAYGIFFVFLAVTGLVPWVRRLFSPALVRGVQLGIGLMLARKAVQLLAEPRLLFGGPDVAPALAPGVAAVALLILWAGRSRLRVSPVLVLVGGGMAAGALLGSGVSPGAGGALLAWMAPRPSLLLNAVLLLMLPQLPLTLGNAVIAAEDACRTCWPGRADRVTVRRLAGSIGLGNILLGLAGGFPMCHGAGGIAAHHRFGGRTGRTTVLLGLGLVAVALVPGGAGVLFLIPVPVLAALLLMVAWSLARLVARLDNGPARFVAVVVAVTGLLTRNLAVALLAGWLVQWLLPRLPFPGGNEPKERTDG